MRVSNMHLLAIRTSGPEQEKSSQQNGENRRMIRFIPAMSGFGQKSNGQSSFLGGLVQ